jgi:HD-like signal output (HDOD) protein
MIAGILLRQAFPAHPKLETIWDQSFKVAITSHHPVRTLRDKNLLRAEDAYTFGLFRDCGVAMMLLRFDDYESTLSVANREPDVAFTEVEQATHGIDHTLVGAKLAEEWLLSDEMCQGIQHHHALGSGSVEVDELSVASQQMIAVTQLSEKLLEDHCLLPKNQEWPRLGMACL